ncbi:hypothetical protein T484DRAFT_1961303 [Baffinella frigidus]|nr:hypothetical protein T484DRAFT_1961303 [Cryptophyta sp. CCMP2293]
MKLLLPALRLPTPSQAGMLQTVGSLALGAACVALGMEADRKLESKNIHHRAGRNVQGFFMY